MPASAGVRTALAVLALTAATAMPAAAHPAVADGGEVPADSLATITLDLVHGCTGDAGHDHGGEDLPTTEVALEVPDAMTHVDPHETEGWQIDTETDDGRVEVVVWSDDGGAEPAPTFDLDVVVAGEPGEQIHLRVVQTCGEHTERWIGTPDEPADDPAVRLTLTEPDPDSPPPEPQTEEEPAAGEATDDTATDDGAADGEGGRDEGGAGETDADQAEDQAEGLADEAVDTDPVAGLEPASGGLGIVPRVIISVLLVAAAAAAVVMLRGRRGGVER